MTGREERRRRKIKSRNSDGLEVAEELNGALASEEVAMDHATDAHHSETAVLDLGKRIALGGVGVLGEAKRIELEVTRGALALEGLEEGDGAENLEEGNPQKDLSHGTLLDKHVVESGHFGATSKACVGRIGSDVLEHGASGGKHGNAAVLELGLLEEADVGNAGEAKGVEADVADHFARRAEGGRALEERHGL